MNQRFKLAAIGAALAFSLAAPAQAQTEIHWWHSMGGALGEWVNDLAKEFNASQSTYKITPTFKGSYDESMTAAIASASILSFSETMRSSNGTSCSQPPSSC